MGQNLQSKKTPGSDDLTPIALQRPDMNSYAEDYLERRDLLLKDTDREIIQKAWFTLSHLLLEEGARVVDMGCNDGALTYAMACLNPAVRFIGLDKDRRKINRAKELYDLHNLEFKIGDATSDIFPAESIDAVINNHILHVIYSGSRYNERIVSDTLSTHFKMLKKGGIMFIRDFAHPAPGEFVLLELPDLPSAGAELTKLSDADLLVWYSEHARPKQDPGCGGFFLEELPPRFPRTRLFRVPSKWAYEFIMRKDDRAHWEIELPMEYTFFTKREFHKELRALGARVQYAAPHWDEKTIEKNFEGRFKLYSDDGQIMGYPQTSYIVVAHKMAERHSLVIEERRPSAKPTGTLKISAVRNEKTGKISDIVSREEHTHEVLPYRIDEEGRLKIYLHDGIARSIVNAVPRTGESLDQKYWSGHMVEAISVPEEAVTQTPVFDKQQTTLLARDYLGLKPAAGAVLEEAQDYYPAPDYIDEKIRTFTLEVEKARSSIIPKPAIAQSAHFQAKGVIREVEAQQVLNAITVGLIPNGRLEMQILDLFSKLGLRAETWTDKEISLQAGEITKKTKIKRLMKQMRMEDVRFRDIKGSAGEIRPIHSTFVEEGQMRGAPTGITAQEVDFIVHDDKTLNTAVVVPLTKDLRKDVHAGFLIDHLPVPKRHEGSSASVRAPSFNLPRKVTNMKQAKAFIAEQFGVRPDMVIKMGEAYYSHLGVTPQKIFPFAVAVPPDFTGIPEMIFLPFYQLKVIKKLLSKEPHFMLTMSRIHQYFHEDMRFEAKIKSLQIQKEQIIGANQNPIWSEPVHFRPAPIVQKKQNEPEETPKIQEAPSPEAEEEIEEFFEILSEENLKPIPEKW